MTVKAFELEDAEATALVAQAEAVTKESRSAAENALNLIDLILKGVTHKRNADDSNEEYIRLLTRSAKRRGRQFGEIVDLDLKNKSIVFKARPRDVIDEQLEEVESADGNKDEDSNPQAQPQA